MNSPLDKRLFWISLALHVVAIFFLGFFNRNSQIRKTFVAYGIHSRKMTNAYFRRLCAPNGGYQRYLKARRAKEAMIRKKRQKASVKKQPKKPVIKKEPKRVPQKKKTIEKKPIKKEIKQEPKKQPAKQKKKPEPKKKKESEEVNDTEKLDEQLPDDSEETLHFNLMGETDPRMIIYQQCIQLEVDRVWRPPLGVPKGTECEVCFVIARNGSIKEFKIQKSSKMLIYDLSIVRVAKEFKFDKCLWGKSFIVTFRQ